MKTLKLFLLLILFFSGKNILSAQDAKLPIDSVTGKCVYSGVIIVDSVSKEELYKRAKDWVVRNMKSSDNNMNLDDKEFNSITSTGNIIISNYNSFNCAFVERYINFKISIYFKNGKAKYLIENMIHNCTARCGMAINGASQSITNPVNPIENLTIFKDKGRNLTYTEVNTKMLKLIDEFSQSLKTKSNQKKDDW